MAEYTTTVDPNGGSDYSSISAWEAGEQGLYTSGDIAIADCKRTGSTKDTTAVTVGGWAAGVIPKIIVNSSYRHEGKWADTRASDGNYIYIVEPGADGDVISGATGGDNIQLHYLLIKPLGTSAASAGISLLRGGNVIESCIINGHGSANTYGIYPGYSSSIRNTIAYGCQRASFGGFRMANNAVVSLDNCTFYDNSLGVRGGGDQTTVRNVGCFGNTTDFYAGTYSASSDYNVSSDASAVGTNVATSKTSYATYFVDTANGDFHLKDTSANLWGINSENLYATFTDDIDGDTRSNDNQFGIGADFYVAAGGSNIGKYNSVLYASIGKINGISLASIGNVNGVTN